MTTFAILAGAALLFLLTIACDAMFAKLVCDQIDRVLPSSRLAHWTVRGVCGILSPVVAFVLLAVGVSAVVPPPQEFTYASLDVSPEATFLQRNAVYVSLKTGWADVEVNPGVLYSIATWKFSNNKSQTYIGLPGIGKWYRL